MLPFGKMGKFFQYKKGKMMARERSEEALGTGPCNWAKVWMPGSQLWVVIKSNGHPADAEAVKQKWLHTALCQVPRYGKP